MMHFYDRATFTESLTLNLEPQLRRLLHARITALGEALIDWTEFLIVEHGDTEADIVRQIGFSPLIEPLEGIRYPAPGFQPAWDLLIDHGGWFEMSVTFGSTFAYVLLIRDRESSKSELLSLCREYAFN